MLKDYGARYAELLLERKENAPKAKEVCAGTIIVKNSRGLYLDLSKTFEGYVSLQELGLKALNDYQIGEKIEILVLDEKANQDGIFRLSIKEIESCKKWEKLKELKDQNLELRITKIVKSGVEAEILTTGQTGFIPFRYLDNKCEALNSKEQDAWINIHIQAKIHEVDQDKNKIILNHRAVSEKQREAKAEEIISGLSIGQKVSGLIVRTTDFGVFVDLGGLDALIPASELSWRRFKEPSEIVKVGDTIEAKIFKLEPTSKKVGLSAKQVEPDPWTTLPENIKAGAEIQGKVITHADFGVFVEVLPGIEALLHKSQIKQDDDFPPIGTTVKAEIISLDTARKRMGIKALSVKEKELERV